MAIFSFSFKPPADLSHLVVKQCKKQWNKNKTCTVWQLPILASPCARLQSGSSLSFRPASRSQSIPRPLAHILLSTARTPTQISGRQWPRNRAYKPCSEVATHASLQPVATGKEPLFAPQLARCFPLYLSSPQSAPFPPRPPRVLAREQA